MKSFSDKVSDMQFKEITQHTSNKRNPFHVDDRLHTCIACPRCKKLIIPDDLIEGKCCPMCENGRNR